MWYIYVSIYIYTHIRVCVYVCIYLLDTFLPKKCWWLRTPASCTAPTAILQFPALIRGLEKWWQPIAPCVEDSRLYGMTSACMWCLCETHLCLLTLHTILFYLQHISSPFLSVVYNHGGRKLVSSCLGCAKFWEGEMLQGGPRLSSGFW